MSLSSSALVGIPSKSIVGLSFSSKVTARLLPFKGFNFYGFFVAAFTLNSYICGGASAALTVWELFLLILYALFGSPDPTLDVFEDMAVLFPSSMLSVSPINPEPFLLKLCAPTVFRASSCHSSLEEGLMYGMLVGVASLPCFSFSSSSRALLISVYLN